MMAALVAMTSNQKAATMSTFMPTPPTTLSACAVAASRAVSAGVGASPSVSSSWVHVASFFDAVEGLPVPAAKVTRSGAVAAGAGCPLPPDGNHGDNKTLRAVNRISGPFTVKAS